jgi:hypothetical protein
MSEPYASIDGLLTAMRPRMQRLILREVLAHLTTHATITLDQVLALHAALHPIHGKPELVKAIQARNIGGFAANELRQTHG